MALEQFDAELTAVGSVGAASSSQGGGGGGYKRQFIAALTQLVLMRVAGLGAVPGDDQGVNEGGNAGSGQGVHPPGLDWLLAGNGHANGGSGAAANGIHTAATESDQPSSVLGFKSSELQGKLAAMGPDPRLMSLRPVVLSHMLHTRMSHLLSSSGGATAAGGQNGRSHTPLLLAALGRWLVHSSTLDLVRAEVDRQVGK